MQKLQLLLVEVIVTPAYFGDLTSAAKPVSLFMLLIQSIVTECQ